MRTPNPYGWSVMHGSWLCILLGAGIVSRSREKQRKVSTNSVKRFLLYARTALWVPSLQATKQHMHKISSIDHAIHQEVFTEWHQLSCIFYMVISPCITIRGVSSWLRRSEILYLWQSKTLHNVICIPGGCRCPSVFLRAIFLSQRATITM